MPRRVNFNGKQFEDTFALADAVASFSRPGDDLSMGYTKEQYDEIQNDPERAANMHRAQHGYKTTYHPDIHSTEFRPVGHMVPGGQRGTADYDDYGSVINRRGDHGYWRAGLIR